ncbi:MAG: V-type ATPase subunit [Anaerolineae bacterium]
MITGTLRYGDLSARARALAGLLLQDEDWRVMLDVEDLAAFLDVLRDLPYARNLSLPEPPSLRALEILFSQVVAQDYEKFMVITRSGLRRLLYELWRQFELDNVKTILRQLAEGETTFDEELIIPLPHSDLPLAQLAQVTDLEGAASALSGTVYDPPLSDALPRYREEGTLFPVEVALDLSHWRRVWQAVRQLGGDDGEWAKRLVGNRLDRLNITWAFRYRIYYHLSAEEIINYTLPYGYRSDDSIVRAIAGGAGIGEVVDMVWGGDTPELAELEAGSSRESLQAFEVALSRLECREARRPFAGQPFHLGVLLGYLIRKECEAHDLTTLAESKAERLPVDQVESYLVSFSP